MTDRFAVHPSNGVVTVTSALVAAVKTRYEITVLARDRASLLTLGENAPAARATLTIRVAPVNLHAPELRVRRLPELVENSTAEIYAIVEVTDRDVGEHGRIAGLEIVDGDPDGHFRVRPSEQPNEYDIVVHALLDRETSPRGYNLTLRALDAGHPPRASYLTLPVTLLDANDNAPVFSREIYEANVPETAPPNTPVIRLKVSDRDEGRNARVYIEIVGGNEGGEFFVNPDTGVLYTAVPLDAEQKSLYTLTVSAIDQGNAGTRKQSSAKVKIGIVDANDNNPVFDRDDVAVTLPENGPTGVVVARVSARDADSGENAYISYSVANLQPIPFEVDHFSGAVRTTKLLDYESMRREYILRIRASDWGLPYRRQAEMRLTVRLEDVNDNRPQFERVDCVGYLPRRLAIGYEIVTLSAIDFDSGDVVSYRLVSGNEDNCFALDSGTGVVSLSCDLADVRADTRVLNVTATDGTHFADPTSLTLHLVGGAGVGASAGDVGALECRDTGVARRLIELLAAAERSNAPIDFTEDFPLAPSRYGENLHVPEFIDFPVEVKVNESVALGTSLVRLRARDRDLGYNGLLVYAISGGDADSAFRIDPDSGELKVIGYLDREKEHEYYLNITVYDLGVPQRSSSRLLPVTVLDVNDNAPKFVKTLSSFRVTENAINGTVIFRANATDRDAGEFARIEYSVIGAGAGEFCVERESGLLAVCAPLDRERHALYELSVRATDGGGLRAEALVRVAVDDVNDNAPRFALPSYSARVREDVPVGTPVAVLEAFDPDLGAGGLITYSLPDQATDDVVFTVDSTSGTVRTAKRLDYEEKQVYGVAVRATDGGQPALWAEATLVVEVGDVDENRHTPVFAERAAVALAVREDAAPGARVGALLALDADPPGRDSRLTYYALDGPGMAYFTIDDTVRRCGTDASGVQVFVEVLDVNDVAPWPERAAYFARVPEHCAAGTRIAVVRAPDGDAEPRPVRYSIVAGNPDGLFAIDERTGEIVTSGRALDREAASAHALEVRAWDGALAAAVRVRVDLTDLNDHAPAFTQRFYDLRVPAPAPVPVHAQADEITTESLESSAEGEAEVEGESEAEGELETEGDSEAEEEVRGGWDEWDEWTEPDSDYVYIGTVTALDPDAAENGTVRYSARARGAARGLLRVTARSGRLHAARALPLLRRAYDLTVVDMGEPRLPSAGAESTATVTVEVANENDCPPQFSQPTYEAEVLLPTASGVRVLELAAHDADAPPAGTLVFDILEGDAEGAFSLSAGGVLAVAQPAALRAEHRMRVRVSDGRFSSTARVVVRAREPDPAGLAFHKTDYYASVLENTTKPSTVAVLSVLGAALNEHVLFSILNPTDGFEIGATSGAVRSGGVALDREVRAAYTLLVRAAAGARRAHARLHVAVGDLNDNCPVFTQRPYAAALPAGEPAGAPVLRVHATDADANDNGEVRYEMKRGNGELFRVDRRTGQISLRQPLEPANHLYTLVVAAFDGGTPACGTEAEVSVRAWGGGAAPRWPRAHYDLQTREDAPPGRALTPALQADSPLARALIYTLHEGPADLFEVHFETGAVVPRGALDYETAREHRLVVRATDAVSGSFADVTVLVRVLDVNDCAPTFPQAEYRVAVREAAPLGASLLTVRADDPDHGDNGNVTYSLSAWSAGGAAVGAVGAVGALQFAVGAHSGEVTVAGALDREQCAEHHLLLTATDAGQPALRTTAHLFILGVIAERGADDTEVEGAGGAGGATPGVMATTRVRVLDVNEHAPSFHSQPYVVQLAENTPPDSYVVQLMADDPDAGSNGEVRFALGGAGGEAGGEALPFAVEAETGWVRTTRALDRETRAEYRVPLLATDGGAPARSARGTLVVRLLDYDDCPPAFHQELYEAQVTRARRQVREDAPAGTVVVRLGVSDADTSGGARSYFVAAGDPSARFQLRASATGAELFVARALDRETAPGYVLDVAAADGKFTAYTRVNVTVLDVNDNPPYCEQHRLSARLPEDAARGAHVATLHVRDADEPHNARARFFLTGDHADHFTIHKETGVISVAEELDRETVAEYQLAAHAQDRDRPEWTCSAELRVVLADVNDNAPRFSVPLYSATLPEDADPGALVAKVHATDADLGENGLVHYSFVEEDEDERDGNAAFELAGDSGIIRLRAALDRELRAEHKLRVRAVDAGVPPRSAFATVRLTVADVNDNPPEFDYKQYRAVVPEMRPVGTELLRVRATSRDAGVNADVYYSLVAGDDREDFALDRATGALTVARPLDFEHRKEYFLTVQAVDGGTPPLSDHATVNITVLDGNDNAPVFSQPSYGARVREDAAPGGLVAQVVALDADEGANGRVTYSIARGDRDGRFAVDPDTGHVSLVAPLDREATPAYVLEVRARDRGQPPLEAAAFLNVEVLDANDNPPLFAQTNYSAVVQEDKPLGFTILKFVVDDADAPPNAAPFTFDFQSGNEMGAFRLEQDGYLRSATRFNHRIKDRYVLQVRVFDNGTPPLFSDAWVYIKVIEESHHPPVVTPLEVVINSYLDEFPGGVIGRVFASDRDAYDTLSYALAATDGAPYPPADLFEIEPATGTLRAAPRLDVGEYRLNVTVHDGKFLGHALVRVAVVLVSDEMLAHAVVIRFREVTDRDFVLSHRKGFIRAVHEATLCRQSDVLIVGVQASDADFEAESTRPRRTTRRIAQDLDVAFAVRSEDGNGFLSPEVMRRSLHAHLERLEESTRLVVEELVRAACGGCVHGACTERVQLHAAAVRAVATEVFALVGAPHRLLAECACSPGFEGDRCERAVASCAECPGARCEAGPAPPGYRCCEDEGGGGGGEELCRAPSPVTYLPSDGYLVYRLERGVVHGERLLEDELTLSLRFRTRRERGVLLQAAGRVEYLVLELAEGAVQCRMELGAGAVALRAGGAVADGAWHWVQLERRGAAVRLAVDRRVAHAQAPARDAVLDARHDRVLVGAALLRHAYALAPEQVTYGFHGCIADVKIGEVALPLEEGGTSSDGRVQLTRRVRARGVLACPALPAPGPCDSYPCLNGGTCRALPEPALLEDAAFACTCHARFAGRFCEIDTDPCASQPCLHGGYCSAERGTFVCACAPGLRGARCERGRWCTPGVCAHGGACEDGERGPACRCRGYYGPRCEYDVDECAGEPCLNGATCLNELGSFRCLCPPNKTGMNCGNPLYSDAVVAGGVGGVGGAGGAAAPRSLHDAWRWAVAARWPLPAAALAVLAALLACVAVPLLRRRRAARARLAHLHHAPLNSELHAPGGGDKAPPPRASKLSNLEAVRRERVERPASCADPPPLNNIDTLRSYGSAGDELEGIPPDYLRNLNIDAADRKPWSEQMHLHTFVDNKIYNDLKGCKRGSRAPAPTSVAASGSPHLVGGYHWDCSDWCGGGGLPGISEVAGSERPDSSEPPSGRERASPSPRAPRPAHPTHPAHHAHAPRRAALTDTDSAPDDLDLDALRFTDASSYLLHPDEYLPAAAGCCEGEDEGEGGGGGGLRRRDPDAASLITMLAEERRSLLGGAGAGSGSDLSANLCEIEDSDAEETAGGGGSGGGSGARHTQV
ncbi:Fat-like cadherin-related tumor suppressor-like [Papilio xuthus]|uniref:Fat-like cadherin-related tumor suppressor-like n=1 Tax=Papilio xuthus TaxID=66420 RepID=A0A194PCL9_PAPXU|nr:Fat-like cadherin-related tumor suppressor-like [Papilio xuthus]